MVADILCLCITCSDPQNQNTETAEMYRIMVADALDEQQNQSTQNVEMNPKNHSYRH